MKEKIKSLASGVLDVLPECLVVPLMHKSQRYYEKKWQATNWNYDCDLGHSPYWLLYRTAGLMVGNRPVVEIGCGNGLFAEYCKTAGITYRLGVDHSPSAVYKATARYNRITGTNIGTIKFVVENIETTSMPYWYYRNDYTCVVALEVLEHVKDDLAVLRAIPVGKYVVLSVPSFWCREHVRRFPSMADVMARYRNLLYFNDQHNIDGKWFLLAGHRI